MSTTHRHKRFSKTPEPTNQSTTPDCVTDMHSSNNAKSVNIGEIVIERNLRSYRKLEIEEEVSERVTVKGKRHYCGKRATGLFRYLSEDAVYPLCVVHGGEIDEIE